MRKKHLRGGMDSSVVGVREDVRPEPAATRLTTALHGERPRQWYRVIARLEVGGTALVAVGGSLGEVLAVARDNAAELPDGTAALHLEEWVGGLLRGFWTRRRCDRNQLPGIPGARKRGRRTAPAAR
jgi:hypothetical protein